jgi:hypothetical protein
MIILMINTLTLDMKLNKLPVNEFQTRDIRLKYVEFRRFFMTEKNVRELSYHNRIFSYWEMDNESQNKKCLKVLVSFIQKTSTC